MGRLRESGQCTLPPLSWLCSGTEKGTPKNFCDKDFAEFSGEFSGATGLKTFVLLGSAFELFIKTLVLLGSALELFRKCFGTVRAFLGFGVRLWL